MSQSGVKVCIKMIGQGAKHIDLLQSFKDFYLTSTKFHISFEVFQLNPDRAASDTQLMSLRSFSAGQLKAQI